MGLESSYRLLDVLRDDGIRTYRAIEIASGLGVQVHLFTQPNSESDSALFKALRALPASKRRVLLEIGIEGDAPYVITEALPDNVTAREWLKKLAGVESKPADPVVLAGTWKTGTPMPEELLKAIHPPAPPRPPAPEPAAKTTDLPVDYTRVMKAPMVAIDMTPVPPPVPKAPPSAPSDFTRVFQAVDSPASPPPSPAPPVAPEAPVPEAPVKEPGEFTRMFQAMQPAPPRSPDCPASCRAPNATTSRRRRARTARSGRVRTIIPIGSPRHPSAHRSRGATRCGCCAEGTRRIHADVPNRGPRRTAATGRPAASSGSSGFARRARRVYENVPGGQTRGTAATRGENRGL